MWTEPDIRRWSFHECQPGYTGPNCTVDIDECMSADCNNGRCIDELASFAILILLESYVKHDLITMNFKYPFTLSIILGVDVQIETAEIAVKPGVNILQHVNIMPETTRNTS